MENMNITEAQLKRFETSLNDFCEYALCISERITGTKSEHVAECRSLDKILAIAGNPSINSIDYLELWEQMSDYIVEFIAETDEIPDRFSEFYDLARELKEETR
jgi:hypothetical protein